MTQNTRYPAITDHSLKVLMADDRGDRLTDELIARTAGAEFIPHVRADLAKAHMIDGDEAEFTGLADSLGRLWRADMLKARQG
jgi:hypothetical protein